MNYQDWLNLFVLPIDKKQVSKKINLKNKGLAKATELIEFDRLDLNTFNQMKIG